MGNGAYGEVRKCKNARTQVVRAVKILKMDKLDDHELQRFQKEIEILKRLDHPNIIKLYEFYKDEKRYYLVTELCSGGELFDELTVRGCFEEDHAAIIIQQVIAAIAYCHRINIVHRDLKPESIFIDQKKALSIKISDFGGSASIQGNEKLKDVVGSAYYIAPEVLTSEYDKKCDCWSIGCILYTMLAGFPPFRGKNEIEIVKNVKAGQYSLEI